MPSAFNIAVAEDTEALMRLINRAFAVELTFIEGDRVDLAEMRRRQQSGVFLAAADWSACVYVETRGDRAYLGLLSVDPARQGEGLGRAMIEAAEQYGRERGCRWMDLTVVNVRLELFPFYRKLGYRECGETPFRSDVEPRIPVHLVNMEKAL